MLHSLLLKSKCRKMYNDMLLYNTIHLDRYKAILSTLVVVAEWFKALVLWPLMA